MDGEQICFVLPSSLNQDNRALAQRKGVSRTTGLERIEIEDENSISDLKIQVKLIFFGFFY